MSRRARLLRRYRRILRLIEREEAVLRRPMKLFRQLHDRDVQLVRQCHRSRRGMRLR